MTEVLGIGEREHRTSIGAEVETMISVAQPPVGHVKHILGRESAPVGLRLDTLHLILGVVNLESQRAVVVKAVTQREVVVGVERCQPVATHEEGVLTSVAYRCKVTLAVLYVTHRHILGSIAVVVRLVELHTEVEVTVLVISVVFTVKHR